MWVFSCVFLAFPGPMHSQCARYNAVGFLLVASRAHLNEVRTRHALPAIGKKNPLVLTATRRKQLVVRGRVKVNERINIFIQAVRGHYLSPYN